MKKVISFSLWGNNPKYCVGAVQNARLAREIFPDWECWFYVTGHYDESVTLEPYLKQIREIGNSRIISVEARGDWRGMFWRFLPSCNRQVDAMISRDCDSRLSLREKAAVDEWLASGKGFHIMRDHPWHGSQMLGGMWGCRGNALPEFVKLMVSWNQEDRWQTDQDFLNTMVYPRIVDDAMIHCSFYAIERHARSFPTPRQGLEFVGQVFDENEQTVQEHINILKSHV